MSRAVIQQLLTQKEVKMFIITVDRAKALKAANVAEFQTNLRYSAFVVIPADVRKTNDLSVNTDCITIHLGNGLVGWILRRLPVSGKFPDFLALIFFSAKDAYIPHRPEIINAIAEAAGKYVQTCRFLRPGVSAAAWAMPLVLGKWVAVTTE